MDPTQDSQQALFRLVLDFYRHPLHHWEWVDPARPLPEGIEALLEIAAADSGPLRGQAAMLGVTPEELHKAGLFFIRQVCLAQESDPYRTLGLAPGASPAQVREHYRKLIRLYHPDRGATRSAWEAPYAVRINRAYRLLRDPNKRRLHPCRTEFTGQVPRRYGFRGLSPIKTPQERGWISLGFRLRSYFPRPRAIARAVLKAYSGWARGARHGCPSRRLRQALRIHTLSLLATVTANALLVANYLFTLYAPVGTVALHRLPARPPEAMAIQTPSASPGQGRPRESSRRWPPLAPGLSAPFRPAALPIRSAGTKAMPTEGIRDKRGAHGGVIPESYEPYHRHRNAPK